MRNEPHLGRTNITHNTRNEINITAMVNITSVISFYKIKVSGPIILRPKSSRYLPAKPPEMNLTSFFERAVAFKTNFGLKPKFPRVNK